MVDKSGNFETQKAYDAIAPLYEEYSQNKKSYLDAVDKLVISKIKETDRLLDVGAGDGRRLAKIKSTVGVKEAVAIEPSDGMADICEKATGSVVHRVFAEKINELNLGKFDVVTALWNVFGHIPNSESRLKSLQNIHDLMSDDSIFIMDVNNRHNASSYGVFNVMKRVIVDTINFKEERGDAVYDWKIGDKIFKSSGHLFTPSEIENLFRKANLKVIERFTFDYNTGEISSSKYKGQLFYLLKVKR